MTQSVGIDVGKEELVACIRDTDGKSAMPAPFPNTSIGLKKLIVHIKKEGISADDPISKARGRTIGKRLARSPTPASSSKLRILCTPSRSHGSPSGNARLTTSTHHT